MHMAGRWPVAQITHQCCRAVEPPANAGRGGL